MRTITAMFDSRTDAETARSRLAAAGISADNVTIHDKTSLGDAEVLADRDDATADGREGTHRNAIGDYIDSRTDERLMENAGSDRGLLGDYVEDGGHPPREPHRSTGNDGKGLWAQIKAFFTGDDDVYEEGMRRGGYLVVARVEDRQAETAIDILDTDGTVDLGSRETEWRSAGWTGGSAGSDRPARPRVGSYTAGDLY